VAGTLLFALTACGSNPQPDSTAQNTEEGSSAPEQEERTESQNSNDEEPQELVTSEAAEQNNILSDPAGGVGTFCGRPEKSFYQ
jgi:hypothetical protein